jgi:hypothetical protein
MTRKGGECHRGRAYASYVEAGLHERPNLGRNLGLIEVPDRDPRVTRETLLLTKASQLRRERRSHAALRQCCERMDTNIAGHAVVRASLHVHDAALVEMEIDTCAVRGGSNAEH